MDKAKSLWCKYYDYILIMLIYGLLHFFMHTDYWDDLTQKTLLKDWNYSLFDFINYSYHNWGSTIILVSAEAILGFLPNFIWKILDIIMIEFIYHFFTRIVQLLSGNSLPKLWAVLFFFNFPYSIFATAGWLTTTIAYAWPFAMFFYSVYILLISAGKPKVKPMTYILFFGAVVFAANYYLDSILLLIIFITIYVTCKTRNRCFNVLFAEGMVCILLNMILLILSPGNMSRNAADAKYHDSAALLSLSITDHLRMGVNTTFYHFVSVPNIILFTFCMILAVCTFLKTKSLPHRLISCIPLLIDIFWTGYVFFQYTIPNRTLTYIYPDPLFQTCPQTEQYCVMASALVMVAAMCYLLAFLTDFSHQSWILIGALLVVGLFPEVALGFTTTISVSIMRVASYFYFALMFCSYMLIVRYNTMKLHLLKTGFYTLAILGALLNILQIIRHIIVYG